MGQEFTNGRGDTHFYPFRRKREAGHSSREFILDNGAPAVLVTDGAKEEGQNAAWNTKWNNYVEDYMIKAKCTEPYSH